MMKAFSFRWRIIGLGALFAVFFCVIVILVLQFNLKDILVEEKIREGENIVLIQSRVVTGLFDKYHDITKSISEVGAIKSFLLDPNSERYALALETLREVDRVDDEYEHIYILDKSGKTVLSTNPDTLGDTAPDRDYFILGMQGKSEVTAIIGRSTGKLGYFFSHPVFDGTGNPIGVLVAKANISKINSALIAGISYTDNNLMLVDKHGIVFASNVSDYFLKSLGELTIEQKNIINQSVLPGQEVLSLQYNTAQELISENKITEPLSYQRQIGGGEKILNITRIGDTSFYLVVETDLDKIYDQISNIVLILIDLVLLGVIFTGFLLYLLVTFFLRPLAILENAAKKISSGDFSQQINIKSDNEFGKLARAFNVMILKLSESYKTLENKVLERTAKLEAATTDLGDQKKAILNILEDVDSQRNKFEELAKRFNLATQSAKIGVWEWDIIKNTLTWDDRMYELYGIKKTDFGGAYDAWQNGLHPDDRKSGDEAIKLALAGKKNFDPIFRVVWPDGSVRYIQAYGLVQRDNAGKPIKMIGVNWDVTKEKEVDRAKSEFVSLASHQLKTPVGAVKWDTEMLLDGDFGKLNAKQKKVVSEIYQLNARMTDLVNSFLNVSRIELGTLSIEPVPTKYDDVCEDVLKELEKKIKDKGHKIVKKYQKNMPETVADPKLLRIIFQNLLSNAVKYTHNDGHVLISIGTENQNIKISVANNGIPISKEEQSKIFNKLFRATGAKDMDPDGNGLGLYLLKSLVEEAGGSVAFTSENGKDNVFTVTFPLPGMKSKHGTKSVSEHENL